MSDWILQGGASKTCDLAQSSRQQVIEVIQPPGPVVVRVRVSICCSSTRSAHVSIVTMLKNGTSERFLLPDRKGYANAHPAVWQVGRVNSMQGTRHRLDAQASAQETAGRDALGWKIRRLTSCHKFGNQDAAWQCSAND